MRIAAAKLVVHFAISCAIDRFKRGSAGTHLSRVGKSFVGAENAQEQRRLLVDAREHARFLKNQGPRKQGKKQQHQEYDASDPARLFEQCSELAYEQENPKWSNCLPLRKPIDAPHRKLAYDLTRVKPLQPKGCLKVLSIKKYRTTMYKVKESCGLGT